MLVVFSFPVAEIDGNTYWRHPFNSLFHPKQLEEFIIMDINRVQEKKKGAGAGARSNKVRVFCLIRCFGLSSPLPPLLSWIILPCSQMDAFLCLGTGKSSSQEDVDSVLVWKLPRSYVNSTSEILFCWRVKLDLLLSLLKLFYISFATL